MKVGNSSMSQKSRIITLSVLSILIVICIVLGVTYSFMQANIDSNSVTEVSLSSCAKITLEDGGDAILLENSYPVSRNKGLQTDPYTFTVTSDCESYVGFNMYLATLNTNTLSDSSVHYVITEHGSKEALVEGILSEAENALSEFNADEQNQLNIGINGTFKTIYKLYNADIPLQGSVTYDLYLFIDESVTNDTMNQVFKAGVAIKSYDRAPTLADVCQNGENLANCIIQLNERDINNISGLYYHNVDLSNGALDKSYRYSGANPNNYVCFGSNETTCPNDSLYRIIGLFDEDCDSLYQVKLIKNDYVNSKMLGIDGRDYLGPYTGTMVNYKGNMIINSVLTYRWNYDTTVSLMGSNNWETSVFNTLNLNTNYVNYLGTDWSNLIANTIWHLGGMDDVTYTAKEFYDGERNNVVFGNNAVTYKAKIGLMYVSDYGYAASQDAWTEDIVSYNILEIAENNWMLMGLSEWTIIPYSLDTFYVFIIRDSGLVSYSLAASSGFTVRPVFYLNSDVSYVSGTGTEKDPYRIQ